MEFLRVNEFFGPTFQGEGPFAGRAVHFLRLNRCNLNCVWCDTPYTWADTENKAAKHQLGVVFPRGENESKLTIDQTLAMLYSNSVSFLVISGGEPLLQARALKELLDNTAIQVQFETAGTLPPLDYGFEANVHYVVSPKLANSGNEQEKRYKPGILKQFVGKDAHFKFVVTQPDDLNEVESIVDEVNIPKGRIWIMPEGIAVVDVMNHAKILADPVLSMGWNMTLRMHTLLWGDERGR
jgi:7-carboxy-7-deazaguanine synthase